MTLVRKTVSVTTKPSRAQKKNVKKAAKIPIVFDEDCPALTEDQLREMAEQARALRKKNNKPVVSLRISPDTFRKARATGPGYTGFLSRLLDNAINDPEMVKKSL